MCFATPSIPSAPPPLPVQPAEDSAQVQAKVDADRRRRDAMNGRQSTILTGPMGLQTPATTMPKTLLGA